MWALWRVGRPFCIPTSLKSMGYFDYSNMQLCDETHSRETAIVINGGWEESIGIRSETRANLNLGQAATGVIRVERMCFRFRARLDAPNLSQTKSQRQRSRRRGILVCSSLWVGRGQLVNGRYQQ